MKFRSEFGELDSADRDPVAGNVKSAAMSKPACFARNWLVKSDVDIGARFLKTFRKRKVTRLKRCCGKYGCCCERTRSRFPGREEGQLPNFRQLADLTLNEFFTFGVRMSMLFRAKDMAVTCTPLRLLGTGFEARTASGYMDRLRIATVASDADEIAQICNSTRCTNFCHARSHSPKE